MRKCRECGKTKHRLKLAAYNLCWECYNRHLDNMMIYAAAKGG